MAENTNPNETVETVETDEVLLTAYRAAQIVNELLKEENVVDETGAPKEIAPQLLYNYVRKGTIETVERDGKKLIPLQALGEWYGKYRSGQLSRGSGGQSVASLANQLKATLK